MSNIVIGIIAGSVVALISFILGLFGQIWYGKHQEKSNRRKDALKKHFEDLEVNAIKPISKILGRVTNSDGTLWERGESSSYSLKDNWPTKDFETGEFLNFKLHFPNQADTMVKLINDVDNHNKTCVSFDAKIKKNLEKKTGLPVRDKGLPFIEDNVPIYLHQTLYHLAVKKLEGDTRSTTYYDFREAEIKDKNDSLWVTTKGPGAIYAKLTNMAEATSFKSAIIELMESPQLQKEMYDIYTEARLLEIVSRYCASVLEFTCDQHDKYGKLLKRKRDCPICKVIFE